jgi:hypothetical protein
MELVIVIVVIVSVSASLGVVAGVNWLSARREQHLRRLERKNTSLQANLEVARARLRQLSERRSL